MIVNLFILWITIQIIIIALVTAFDENKNAKTDEDKIKGVLWLYVFIFPLFAFLPDEETKGKPVSST